jgi:hypothetical protein
LPIFDPDFQAFLMEEEVENFTLPETAAPPALLHRNAAGDWVN